MSRIVRTSVLRRALAATFVGAIALVGTSMTAGGATAPTVPLPPPPGAGPGYWLVGGDGGVFPFGRGAYKGGLAEKHINAAVTAAAVTPDGLGYWLAGADGGVFAFGDAPWFGALAASARTSRIVGIAATPSGKGYWLVGSDGGVYAFGDAPYLGGRAGLPSASIVGVTATPDGLGYWLAGADGAVYAYGDATFFGGLAGNPLAAPIVSMVATEDGLGYWLAAADGGVFAFGRAPWLGGLSGAPHTAIAGMARLTRGVGYWLVAADGGVFTFGGAGYFGGVGASRLNRGIVAIVSGDGTAIPTAQGYPVSTKGFDISWPQCDAIRPAPPYGFGVVGVTSGHLFSVNPCLHTQWGWATTYGSFGAPYLNTNAPTADEYAAFLTGPASRCGADAGCALDLWGRKGAEQAVRDARDLPAPMWWLDVETSNQWLPDTAANAVILRAMVDVLRHAHKFVGIYSTSYQWSLIVGGYSPGLPTWIAGAPQDTPASYCDGHSFGGGIAWLTQSGDPNFDTDVLCPAGLANYKVAFAPPTPPAVPQYEVAGAGESRPVRASTPTTVGPDAVVSPVVPVTPPMAVPGPIRRAAQGGPSRHVFDVLAGAALMLATGAVSRRRVLAR